MTDFEPIEIYDVIDYNYSMEILNKVTNIDFDWHFMNDTTYEDRLDQDPRHSTPSFAHLIYHPNNQHNPHLDFFMPLLNATCEKAGLELHTLLRMRLGFLLNTKYSFPHLPYEYNTPHRDYEQEHFTACYYVNSSDGDTVIFHEKDQPLLTGQKYHRKFKSEPLQGKVLVFNGWHFHASTCPKMHNQRIVLTMNFTAGQKNG